MANREKVDLLREHAELLGDLDPEVEALRWDWASLGQLREWLECGLCVRGDVARALRNVGCTPAMCALEIMTPSGMRRAIGLLAAEGQITVQDARRRAILDAK